MSSFWIRSWSQLFAELSGAELRWLVSSVPHPPMLARRRAAAIGSRVVIIATLLAIITPMWIVVDILTLPWPAWLGFAVARLFAALGFAAVVIACNRLERPEEGHRLLAVLVAIPLVFFVFSDFFLDRSGVAVPAESIAAGFGFTPFVLVAGLALFALTLSEATFYVAGIFAVQAVAALARTTAEPLQLAVQFCLLAIVALVAILAGLSQLALLIALTRDAIRDGLTGAFSRRAGEELLELQFALALRKDAPVALAFVDVDRMRRITEDYGQESADRILAQTIRRLRNRLRTTDLLARWAGEEFILIMPNTQAAQAVAVLERVRQGGFGTRPDGQRITASFGVAERIQDGAAGWRELVQIADRRAYAAKRNGRDRIVAEN
jgi:diguanylate cyclase (GGDEF)-like protein